MKSRGGKDVVPLDDGQRKINQRITEIVDTCPSMLAVANRKPVGYSFEIKKKHKEGLRMLVSMAWDKHLDSSYSPKAAEPLYATAYALLEKVFTIVKLPLADDERHIAAAIQIPLPEDTVTPPPRTGGKGGRS